MKTKDLMATTGQTLLAEVLDSSSLGGSLGQHDTPADHAYLQWLLASPRSPHEMEGLEYCLRWAAFGCPCFSLSEGLTAKLLLTDAGAVSGEEVQPPFPAFMVEIPPGYISITDGVQTRDLAYLTFHRIPDSKIRVAETFSLQAFPLEHVREIKQKFLASPALDLWRFTGVVRRSDDAGRLWDSTGRPAEGEKLDHWLYTRLSREAQERRAQDILGSTQFSSDHLLGPVGPEDHDATTAVRVLMVNLMLYLGSLPALPKSSVSKPKWSRRKPGGVTTYRLGQKIKLSADLRAAAKDYGAHTPNTNWKLRSRFTVRGHWRNQVCGPAGTQRKRIWIDPYWKGEKTEEQLRREYEVKE